MTPDLDPVAPASVTGIDAIWDVDTLSDGAITTFADSVGALNLVALSAGQVTVGDTTQNGHKVARWDGRSGGGLQVGDASRFTYFHEPTGVGWLLVVGDISLDSPSSELFTTLLGGDPGPGWHLQYLTHDSGRVPGFWSRAFDDAGVRIWRAPHAGALYSGWAAAVFEFDMPARHDSASGNMSFHNDGHAARVAIGYGGGVVGPLAYAQDADDPVTPDTGDCSGGFAVGVGLGGDLAYWAVGEGTITDDEARGMVKWCVDRFAL